jgi:cytochrome c peroxidase
MLPQKPFAKRFPSLVCMILLFATAGFAQSLTSKEQLGKSIFFDENLSFNSNLSCASCHSPDTGFTGPQSMTNAHGTVYEGSISGRFGNRKPPSAAYATLSPILDYIMEKKEALFSGGNFWNGRATGEKLGNPAADQAQGPFLNPAEQALPDSACVVKRVCDASYPVLFQDVWGTEACNISWPSDVDTTCSTENTTVTLSSADRAKVEAAYDDIALSVAAYEASPEVNQFTSKYDYYLKGMATLTRQEKQGLALFQGKGKCDNCHVIGKGKGPKAEPALFTDFTFDNLGVPKNPENPATLPGSDFVDYGLGEYLESRTEYESFAEENLGKQKVPTLRNVDKRPSAEFVKAYTHNGYFKSLASIVHFYNTRDVLPTCPGDYTEAEALANNCWPPPEVSETVNHDELGNLHLTAAQEAAIVAFLKTLSDGYTPPAVAAAKAH